MKLIEIALLILSVALLFALTIGTEVFGIYTIDVALLNVGIICSLLMIILYKFCEIQKKVEEGQF